MADEDLYALGEDLVTTASRIARWVPKQGCDLSLSSLRLLARLIEGGPTRISDLAVAERCSQPTITHQVKRLESLGLVTRTAYPRDARAWMIDLTPRGRDQVLEIRGTLGRNVHPYLSRLSDADIRALREGLVALRRLMGLPAEGADEWAGTPSGAEGERASPSTRAG